MKTLFDNTLFSSIDATILVALNLLATPILIRSLGTAEYGVFVFLSIFSTYGLLSFFDLGMEGSLLNFVARYEAAGEREKIQDCLSVTIIYYGGIGLLLGGALYLLSGAIAGRFIDDSGTLNRADVLLAAKVISLNVFIQFLSLPFRAVLQGLRRYVITKSVNSILMILQYIGLIAAAVYFEQISIAFMVILCITTLRLMLLGFIARFKTEHFARMHFRIRTGIFRSLFSYSSVLLVSRIIGIIFNQMDKFLIWLFLATTQMAIYDIVVRPANLIRLLITTVNSAIIPEVARLHEKGDNEKIRELYVRLVRYTYLVMLPIIVLLYVWMEDILTFWVGAELGSNFNLAWIILTVYLLSPVGAVASTMAVGLEMVKKVLWISIAASIINVALSLTLLPLYGLAGLLIATLCAQLFMALPYYSFMRKTVGLEIGQLLQPVVGLIGMALPFAGGGLLVWQVYGASPEIWLPTVACLTALHYLLNYRLLLNDEERSYIIARLRPSRSIPTVSSGSKV